MKRRSILPAAALSLALALLTGCGAAGADTAVPSGTDADAAETAAELEVLCFDAGSADAFLLTTPESAVLIDTGLKGFGKMILAVLEQKGIEKLDCMIISHFDKDHVGGAARILNNFPVETVLQSNSPKDSEEYEKYVKALRNASMEAVTVREDYEFTLDGVTYTVNPPKKNNYASDDSNNSSLIVTVTNGEHRFLFTGDAQTERLEEFLSGGTETCDVLKVPHHGREEPLTEALVEAVSPQYAVITSSEEEPEAESTLNALSGAEVLLTREGEMTFYSDGTDLTVSRTHTAEESVG